LVQLKALKHYQRNKMAKTNTEKPAGKAEQKKKLVEAASKKEEISETKNVKAEEKIKKETEDAKEPPQKKVVKGTEKPKEKKQSAIVNSKNVPVSTKYAVAICKFLKGKEIEKAISDLEKVALKKKAVPMKGEIAHRKGKIMSGKFPVRSSQHFITILKSLRGNALVNEIEEPIIVSAIPNQASRPFGGFGRIERKRSHITLVAKSKIKKKEKKE
jgi:ribosomal protein L22